VSSRNAMVLIFAALLIREAWLLLRLLLPNSEAEIQPFLYSTISISWESYLYFACFYVSMMLIAWAFLCVIPEYHTILTVWFFLQGIELFDYFLTYNTPWFYIGILGVSITLIKFIILGFLILNEWTKR
jgi:hypothetical protein